MSLVQRYRDYLRERRIARLRREATAHINARQGDQARDAVRLMTDEINARSRSYSVSQYPMTLPIAQQSSGSR